MKDALRRIGAAILVAAITPAAHAAPRAQPTPDAPQVTLASLLDEMTDRDSLARWPDPAYTTGQTSSYDRRSTSRADETWWANADAGNYLDAIERDGRTEHVMLDADGPGAVVRIWSANPKGTLRVYLDGADEPAIEAPMADLMGARAFVPEPLAGVRSRGYNLYLPIPYEDHCLITSDEPGFYFHVNYRTYEHATTVEPFTMDALRDQMPAIERLAGQLAAKPLGQPGEEVDTFRGSLLPGQPVQVRQWTGPGCVTGIELQVDSTAPIDEVLRGLILEMHFDDQRTVWVPVGDLASGIGLNPMTDWMRLVEDDATTTIRWPMPFRYSGTLRLHNLGPHRLRVNGGVVVEDRDWDDRSMHFHATWRQQRDIPTIPRRDFNYVDVKGRGVLVGDQLTVVNPVKAWWGEGDEKIYVDDMSFPAHFGTGTEDYYGYAWCCPDPFQAPFHSQVRCDGAERANNWGTTTVSRIRALDAVPFRDRLKLDMELWHWKEVEVSMAATTFFYAEPGAAVDVEPSPEEVRAGPPEAPPLPPPYRIEGAIEAETLTILARSRDIPVGPQGGFGPDLWSDETQLWIRAREVGDFVELEVPINHDGPVRLDAVLTESWDYAIIQFTVNGQPAGEPIDLWCGPEREVRSTGPVTLGTFEPEDGVLEVRAEVVGRAEGNADPGTYLGIDCFIAMPADEAEGS